MAEEMLETPGLAAPVDTIIKDEPVEKVVIASQWQLIWWKFRKHKLAMVSLIFILAMYVIAIFAGFFAPTTADPSDLQTPNYTAPSSYHLTAYVNAPPMPIYWIDNGKFAPYVYAYKTIMDKTTFEETFAPDTDHKIPLGFFVHGDKYSVGLHSIPIDFIKAIHFESDIHLFGPVNPQDPFYVAGADNVGRDLLSRLIYASQVSLSVGLVGVFLSLILGVILGGLSGLVGGWVDNVIQRSIEVIRSIPNIPLWMAIAVAVPPTWDPVYVYFGITVILALLGWTDMARAVRGKFIALREEDFIRAAELDGVSRYRIIVKHMVPSFLSHIIASMTLAIPGMILGESALSFLGVGLRPPVVSWGVLLNKAINVNDIMLKPWLLLPGLAIFLTVLAFNFLGDGLRDAADPYHV